jgi:hypothetical protein
MFLANFQTTGIVVATMKAGAAYVPSLRRSPIASLVSGTTIKVRSLKASQSGCRSK